jgi:hypothetical protein
MAVLLRELIPASLLLPRKLKNIQKQLPRRQSKSNIGTDMGSRAMRMNAGEKTIDWLFREQLRRVAYVTPTVGIGHRIVR